MGANKMTTSLSAKLHEHRLSSHIFWTPHILSHILHTLNLALKNICAPNNIKKELTYEQFSWIIDNTEDANFINTFIINYLIRLSIFNECVKLKILGVAGTYFERMIVIHKRIKIIK